MSINKISFIILNYNGKNILKESIPSIITAADNSPVYCDIHVIDNCSNDDSIAFLKENCPSLIIYKATKNNFLFSYNEYLPKIDSDLVFLFNNDVKVESDFISYLLPYFEDNKTFMVTPQLRSWDGSHYTGGLNYLNMKYGIIEFSHSDKKTGKDYKQPQKTFYSFNALFDRKKVLALNGLDELYSPYTWEDVDLCYRASLKGWNNYYEPQSVVYHYEEYTINRCKPQKGKTNRRIITRRNRLLFFWKNIRDPYLWINHLVFMPLRLVWSLFFDRAMIVAFWLAVLRNKRCRRQNYFCD